MKLADVQDRMQKSVDSLLRSFNTIRTGRANASLLDRVMVDYYGSPTPLNSLAGISTPDSSTLMIQPYDKGSLSDVERALHESDLGLNPNNDGSVIRLNIPPLTEERRKELVKIASKYAEEAKVAVRNIRRDAIDDIRKQEKNSDLSKDESRDRQDEIQQETDNFIAKVDSLLKEKEKDILSV